MGIREDTGDPVEEDKEWLQDHGKAEGEPDDIVDENQPNSSVDEAHETQNNFTPNRTWVVEPERLPKPKPRKRRRVKKGERNNEADRSYPRSTCGNEGKPKMGHKHRKTR